MQFGPSRVRGEEHREKARGTRAVGNPERKPGRREVSGRLTDRIATVNFRCQARPVHAHHERRHAFEVAANAIGWWEESCKQFGTSVQLRDDQILTVDLVAGERYRVRVRPTREWLRRRDEAGSFNNALPN